MNLVADRIRGVQHIVQRIFEQLLVGFLCIKHFEGYGIALRIDIGNAVFHQLRLGFADSGQESMNLPVDVGNVHNVLVDHDNPANTGAGQGFSGNGAHSADTQHSHCAVLQDVQPFRSNGKLRTGKLMQHRVKSS
ncbi:hypothetical protein D3C76_1306220 [compost metagenome]